MSLKSIIPALALALLVGCAQKESTNVIDWSANAEYYQTAPSEALIADAQGDDPVAMVYLGIRKMNGDRIERDEQGAIELFHRAADLGEPRGWFYWGAAYVNGSGVEQDEARGAEYVRKAAELNFPLAQYWYGFLLVNNRTGNGIEDWENGVPWFEKAAENGNSDAAFMIANGYDLALGTMPQDYEKAAYWYRKANEIGFNQKAQFNLRRLIELGLTEWQEGDPGVPPGTESAPNG